MLQQQQAAFQTMSQFGGEQGSQNAAFVQSVPSMVAAPAVGPAVMSQPASASALVAIPGMVP